MPDNCLPCKEIIDNGMGIYSARMYGNVLEKNGAGAKHFEAARFYADTLENIFSPLAKRWLANGSGLSEEQTDRLMDQIDKECYRSDEMIAWALIDDPGEAALDGWTTKVLGWAKDSQTFYTAMSEEVKP